MKTSIVNKLFFVIVLIFIMISIFGIVFNKLYLEKFYINNNKTSLNNAISATIKTIGNSEEIKEIDLEQIESEYGIKLFIIERKKVEELLSSSVEQVNEEYRHEKNKDKKHYARAYTLIKKFDLEMYSKMMQGKTVYKELTPPENRAKLLVVAKMDNSGNLILATKSIVALREAVKIANEFYNIASVLSLILGIVFFFMISKKITKPLLNINQAARALSMFDFKKKVNINTGDELQELGESINHLSEQLENKINEISMANEKLTLEIEKERRIEKMRREFLSNVSHELKTPISIIGGYAEGLKDRVNVDDESRDYYAGVISDETKKMSKMVLELLELSKLESDTRPLIKEEVEIVDIVEAIIKKYRNLTGTKEIDITLRKSKEEVFINGNLDLMENVVNNILINAIKHTFENGKIFIEILDEEEKVIIKIENTGEKIPEDKFEEIWRPFYKVDSARIRNESGTGLGLAIVKSIMERHNGSYAVYNTENGVCFSCTFPK